MDYKAIWTWFSIFFSADDSVNSGTHYLPLIDAPQPTDAQLEQLTQIQTRDWLDEQIANQSISLQRASSSIKIILLDAVFDVNDYPSLSENFSLIEGRTSEKRYRAALTIDRGLKYSDKVWKLLDSKTRRRGPTGIKYETARSSHETKMSDLIVKLIHSYLFKNIQIISRWLNEIRGQKCFVWFKKLAVVENFAENLWENKYYLHSTNS